jgi:hypothetical protein
MFDGSGLHVRRDLRSRLDMAGAPPNADLCRSAHSTKTAKSAKTTKESNHPYGLASKRIPRFLHL